MYRVIIAFAVLDFMLFVTGLGLSGNNRRGFFEGSIFFITSDVIAAFAFVGNSLGIIISLWILIMGGIDEWNRETLVAWVVVSAIMLWFLCGTIGMWCFQMSAENAILPELYLVEFGIEVTASAIFLILLAFVVSRMKQKEIAK